MLKNREDKSPPPAASQSELYRSKISGMVASKAFEEVR
jgi:hypothetical protein